MIQAGGWEGGCSPHGSPSCRRKITSCAHSAIGRRKDLLTRSVWQERAGRRRGEGSRGEQFHEVPVGPRTPLPDGVPSPTPVCSFICQICIQSTLHSRSSQGSRDTVMSRCTDRCPCAGHSPVGAGRQGNDCSAGFEARYESVSERVGSGASREPSRGPSGSKG